MQRTPCKENISQQTKRRLNETSPEDRNMSKKPVGNMEVGELMEMMKLTMNSLLEEKLENLPTKKDLESIKSDINNVCEEIGTLKSENIKLKEEIGCLKHKIEEDENNIRWLEHQIKNTKLVFKGLVFENSVLKVCEENLNIKAKISSAQIVAVRNNTYTIIAEFENETVVNQVLHTTKNLAGTSISIDRDLNPRRQKNKKAMLALRRLILADSNKHKITVRDDKMLISNKRFQWNSKNELMCGNQPAEEIFKMLYGPDLKKASFNDMYEILTTNSKN